LTWSLSETDRKKERRRGSIHLLSYRKIRGEEKRGAGEWGQKSGLKKGGRVQKDSLREKKMKKVELKGVKSVLIRSVDLEIKKGEKDGEGEVTLRLSARSMGRMDIKRVGGGVGGTSEKVESGKTRNFGEPTKPAAIFRGGEVEMCRG